MSQKDNSAKLRGSYPTPYSIAKFLSDWAITAQKDSILEPGCGEGNFLEAAFKKLQCLGATIEQIEQQIVGVEIYKEDCKKASSRLINLAAETDEYIKVEFQIECSDFFQYYSRNYGKKFDVVVGNPPFIRYQDWDEKQRKLAFQIMKAVNIKPNRLTNAWMPFLVVGSLSLKANGKLAMVIPAELLQVKYAEQLRLFLSNFFNSISIISFKKLVFPDIQQEVVLLLAEKKAKNGHGINMIELNDASDLETLDMETVRRSLKPIEHTADKWTQYFLTSEEILLLREMKNHEDVKKLGDIASVDVGIVTGKNAFFVINKTTLNEYNLANYVLPLVGRTPYIKGIIYKKEDWNKLKLRDVKSYLLNLPPTSSSRFKEGLNEYLKIGEQKGVDEGYKCSIRKYWYSVPSVWVSDAFLTRQINAYPKLVLNEAQAAVTDTIHRVKFNNGINYDNIALCFLNSMTFAFSEIVGRSYGGGVLCLEPNEAELLPISYFDVQKELDIKKIDELIREGDIYKVLDITDSVILHDHLKLSSHQMNMLRGIWEKLSNRRLERK